MAPSSRSSKRFGRKAKPRTYGDTTPLLRQPNPSNLFNVSQLQGGASIIKGAVDTGNGYAFTLSAIPNASGFSMFDMYRINSVEVEYLLNQQAATALYPTLYWSPDYDDASAPTSLIALQAYETCEVFQFSPTKVSFRRKMVPRVAQTAYQAGVATGYTIGSQALWINTDSNAVQYYGMKHWLSNYNSTAANSTNVIIVIRYNLSFKMVK
jgi:hypothetical protein